MWAQCNNAGKQLIVAEPEIFRNFADLPQKLL